jgi:hypothetical protein
MGVSGKKDALGYCEPDQRAATNGTRKSAKKNAPTIAGGAFVESDDWRLNQD